MDRHGFYTDEIVTPADLTEMESFPEAADAARVADLHGEGIAYGLELVEAGTPSLTMQVRAGVAYAHDGRRCEVAADTPVDLSQDSASVSTAVTAGHERMVAVYLHPKRTQERPYSSPTDGDGFGLQRETVELLVVAGPSVVTSGTPGSSATPPSAPYSNAVLLGRVVRLPDSPSAQVLHTADVRLTDVLRIPRAPDLHAEAVERRLEVMPTDPPSLKAAVAAGEAQIDGATVVWGGGPSPSFVAPSTHGRIDLLYLRADATLAIRQGTESVSPARPSTQGVFPLAFVGLEPGQTAILEEHLADARPFLAVQTLVSRSYRLAATGGETAITLPWTYTPGAGALEVVKNGVVLDSAQYTETDSSTVTLGAALTTGQVLFVRALTEAPVGVVTLQDVAEDLSGVLLGSLELRVSSDRATVRLKGVSLLSARGLLMVPDGLTVGASAIEGGGGYAANHWYYLYVWNDPVSGIQAQLSSTAPDATRTWKAGYVGLRRYVGAVRTGTDALLLPMQMTAGRYVYVASGAVVGERQALVSGTATSWTAVSFATWVPPHARVVTVEARVISDSGGDCSARLRRAGDSTDYEEVFAPVASWVAQRDLELVTDSSQRLEYQINNSHGNLSLFARGWAE